MNRTQLNLVWLSLWITLTTALGLDWKSGEKIRTPIAVYSVNHRLKYRLVAEKKMARVAGKEILATVYNGQYIPPTLVVSPGDTIELTLENHLAQTTNLHFHGMHVSPRGNSDNIFTSVEPGQIFTYVVHVPLDHDSGTYWYHSHDMNWGEEQVFGGLSGAIFVRGYKKALPREFASIEEDLLEFKDVQIEEENGEPAIVSNNIDSNAPTTRLINGELNPFVFIRPGQTKLWHLANVGADIFYDVALEGSAWWVIAEDGHTVVSAYSTSHLVMPPGKRFDVLVQGGKVGLQKLITRAYSTGPAGDSYPQATLATLVTEGLPVKPFSLPITLNKTYEDLSQGEVSEERRLIFTEDPATNEFYINGRQFDPNRIDVAGSLGQIEEWTVINATAEQHPFHLHTNAFQVIKINGKKQEVLSPIDTQIIPVGGEFIMRVRWQDFTGIFPFHCHIMAHEERGMMGLVEVQ